MCDRVCFEFLYEYDLPFTVIDISNDTLKFDFSLSLIQRCFNRKHREGFPR